ncbi:MAG: BspA family leucine-rich repeat surface protein [Akkermansia sp.]|nr:BspA family leucine-rich repeat surface protein [Akkermansia sp.]
MSAPVLAGPVEWGNFCNAAEIKSIRFVDQYDDSLLPDGVTVVAGGYPAGDAEDFTNFDRVTAYVLSDSSVIVAGDGSGKIMAHTDSGDLFYGLSSLVSIIGLEVLDTSQVAAMDRMFYGCSALSSVDFSHFNTRNVTNMRDMFRECSSLVSLDLSSFDTSGVTDMVRMFNGCTSLTTVDVSGFDTSRVTSMSQMFWNCSSLKRLKVNNFDTSAVQNMSGMFGGCSTVPSLDLSGFDTGRVTNVLSMFNNCSLLARIYVSESWSNASVTSSSSMFSGCTNLAGGNGTTYNASVVDVTYARVDTPDTPGYFTYKRYVDRSIEYLIKAGTMADIAEAIREKTGSTDSLTPSQMIDAIQSIQGGGSGEAEESVLGEKLYTFAVFADIHQTETDYQGGVTDFTRAMPYVESKGADFACIAGDLGRESTDPELVIYKNQVATANIPYYACRGNHDAPYSESHWQACVGNPSNFTFVRNGDVFIFVSPDEHPNYSISGTVPYAGSMAWLKEQLAIYKGARIFLFIHFPPSGYSGLLTDQYYGFTSGSTEDDEIITEVNKTKNVIMFHGHTHFHFGLEEDYDNINVYRFNASKTALVHVPSCSHCRDESMTAMTELSQGYIVEVYEQGVSLKGIDFTTGEYMPDYEYLLPVDNNPDAVKNAIVVSDEDKTLRLGESATVEVYTTMGAATVRVTPSNSAITVSPQTLTFTDANHATRQTVTITAAADVGEITGATVTLSADGLTSKMVSVTLSTGQLEYTELTAGQHIVKDGEAYTGTYSGVQVEFTSGTYDITFDNLTVKGSSSTVLHTNDEDVSATIRCIGTNHISCTSNRAMSLECDYPTVFIGEGDGASLHLESSYSSNAAVKGEVEIYDLDFKITSKKMPLNGLGTGFTLYRKGSFEINGAKVVLLPSEGGEVNLGFGTAPTPGSSDIDIDATPSAGYTLTDILVNGASVGVDGDHQTMPAANATMTIQCVFSDGSGGGSGGGNSGGTDTPTSEVLTIPWVDNLKIQSNAAVESTDTTVMSTMEYIPIESGYTYELSTTTLGTLGLRIMYYDGARYQDFLDKSDDIGETVFPSQYKYTLVIPSGATYFRIRAKTDGDHQTWKDRIVLTKIKNA